MADIFDVDYQLQTANLITPTKRTQINLCYVGSIAANLQYNHDNLFGDYKKGSSAPNYNIGTTYVKYDKVIFNKGVYESLVNGNIGILPVSDPLSETNWRRMQDNFIGVDERIKYNSQNIFLAYSINKWFSISSAPFAWIDNNLSAGLGFTLWFPSAIYTTLGTNSTNREGAVREFVSKYAAAGLVYDVQTF